MADDISSGIADGCGSRFASRSNICSNHGGCSVTESILCTHGSCAPYGDLQGYSICTGCKYATILSKITPGLEHYHLSDKSIHSD